MQTATTITIHYVPLKTHSKGKRNSTHDKVNSLTTEHSLPAAHRSSESVTLRLSCTSMSSCQLTIELGQTLTRSAD